MIKLDDKYEQLPFLELLQDLLPDFEKDVRKIDVSTFKVFESGNYLGKSKKLDLQVFEVKHQSSNTARVAIATDGFRLMKQSAVYRAIIVFRTENSEDWRLSLMTLTPERNETGGVSVQVSNPRRYSYLLGQKAKINTPTKFLLSKGKIADFEDLKNRFSIEVVNKEFYNEISKAFTSLVSGKLKLPDRVDFGKENLEFAVRMIGRIIFCWFLREKISDTGKSLMPKDLLSLEAVISNKDYYHKILEPIFFEVLNKPAKSRNPDFAESPFSSIPYLNGGLFSPQDDDFYKRTKDDFQSQYHNTLIIPDEWFKDFFEILETYNFTIDENTSYDEELSIDPEMLGRIFENLLAEINPETGESARKSTGSYYTPRVIVNYMVDESLLLYLKNKTNIDEGKLKAIISYDLSDDTTNPIGNDEKEKIIDALEKVKILDPACGSGAFPMGALQKIVFILQQTDPDGQLWFKKQIKNTSPEVRRVVEREFEHKNFDYIRKLGIIRENIYGVDIQAIATEISRLRCFLTLVVDERIQDELENRGIEPLPNLDFKFVTANSLIGLPKIDLSQQSMFDDYQKINELKQIRDQYFNASGIEREQLKTEFVMQQKGLVDQLIKEHGFMGVAKAELTQKLTNWEPFKHKSASWFDSEWMFGIKDGFDIVIANPPYVTSKYGKISEEEKSLYKKLFYSAYDKMDLYVLFLEKGIKLSKLGGFSTMITPWNFLKNFYSFKIRKFILDNCKIILFYKLPPNVFNSVIVDNIISIFQHFDGQDKLNNKILFDDIFDIKNRKYIYQSSYVNSDKNVFSLPVTKEANVILNKMNADSVPLGKIALNYIGIMTGGQKAMIADKPIFKNSKPVLSGKEIGKWFYLDIGKYVNFDKSKIHSNDNEKVYLAAKKILLRKTGKILTACLDQKQYFTIQSLYNITITDNKYKEEYILALLNSKLFNYLYNKFFITNPEVFPYIKRRHLDMLPIRKVDSGVQQKFIDVVAKILDLSGLSGYSSDSRKQGQVEGYEKQIDQMVYKLYDLTIEEIEIVENG